MRQTERRLTGGALSTIGFILSPLSWWNDAFVNLPISYALAMPFGMISEKLFLPAMVAAYWLTNVAGLILLHGGIRGLAGKKAARVNWKRDAAVSALYTCIIVALAAAGVLKPPSRYLAH